MKEERGMYAVQTVLDDKDQFEWLFVFNVVKINSQ